MGTRTGDGSPAESEKWSYESGTTMSERREDSVPSRRLGDVQTVINGQLNKEETVQHVRESFLDLPNLVRSIQRAEGNIDCFQRLDSCEETSCCWRPYCLDKPSGIL
jgi:hypothetical protein